VETRPRLTRQIPKSPKATSESGFNDPFSFFTLARMFANPNPYLVSAGYSTKTHAPHSAIFH
jgi:hypothetical protein